MARLYTQMAGTLDFENADNHGKVHIMCEAFAVHSIISYFGKKHLQKMKNSKYAKLLCNDNLDECVKKANGLLNHAKFVTMVGFVAGYDHQDVK